MLAMTLFFDDAYEEVMRKLVDGLRFLRSWDEDWQVPSASALCQARARLGAEPVRELYARVARRLADAGTPGAWLADLRVMAIDGVQLDVADGTWSVLVHAFPDAGVPVVQLSINANKPLDYHLELGATLAPLRERGVLIISSGNVVHNLGGIDWQRPYAGYDWAVRFDEEAKQRMVSAPSDAAGLDGHPDYRKAVPTPDHFIPLLYFGGLAASTPRGVDVLIEGCAYGSLSMTAYTLGLACSATSSAAYEAAQTPEFPADASNI